MSERIEVGDLVMVVRGRPCCGHLTGAEGMCFVVSWIIVHVERCSVCGGPMSDPAAYGCPGRKAIDLPRLKKIPPLSTTETVNEREEQPA